MSAVRQPTRPAVQPWSAARALWAILLLIAAPQSSPAAPEVNAFQPTEAEAWVIDKVAKGETASFSQDPLVVGVRIVGLLSTAAGGGPLLAASALPPERASEKRRTLRGTFLQRLLMGAFHKDKSVKAVKIEGAKIDGEVILVYEVLPYDIKLINCDFQGDVDFSGSELKEVRLSFSRFHEGATFRKVKLLRSFRMYDTHFLHYREIQFTGLDSKDVIDIRRTIFTGTVSFSYSHMDVGYFYDVTFKSEARFWYLKVDSELEFKRVHADKLVIFDNSSIGGAVDFTESVFNYRVSMEDVSIKGTLGIKSVSWPDDPAKKNQISRLSYGEVAPWEKMKELLDRSEYTADAYVRLETFLRREGQLDEANEVGFERTRRVRQSLGWSSPSYWGSCFLMLLAGNGYYPEFALLWACAIVLVGGFIFRPHYMQRASSNPGGSSGSAGRVGASAPRRTGRMGRWLGVFHRTRRVNERCNPFLYSLDLFIPGINLDYAKEWSPAPSHPWVRAWMYAERISGWIIVPIGLLAVSGLVKTP